MPLSLYSQSFPTQGFIKYSLPKVPGRKSVEIVSEQTNESKNRDVCIKSLMKSVALASADVLLCYRNKQFCDAIK